MAGAALSALAVLDLELSSVHWPAFIVLTLLATLAQLFEAEAPANQSYYPHLVFFFAGVFLLPPSLFVLLIAIPHLVEWAKKRLEDSRLLRDWYIQPFNIATHVIAGSAAYRLHVTLSTDPTRFLTLPAVLAVTAGAVAYVFLNHLLIGLALFLARGLSWRESDILNMENLVSDLIMLLLGFVVGVLWKLSPWLVIPALSPLVLMQRGLMVPKLKQEAQTDEKTGLLNARYFVNLFEMEIERARRLGRPATVIMSDLDLLRNINNTYGHLAGDAVLTGVGEIIRDTIRGYDLAARFGGEEFTIFLPEVELIEGKAFAERLRKAIEAADFEVKTSATPIKATMSFGVASFPLDADTPTLLIHEADVAVYQAKLRGRNCVVCASDIPRTVQLDNETVEDRVETPYLVAFAPRPISTSQGPPQSERVAQAVSPPAIAPTPPVEEERHAETRHPPALRWSFVGGIVVAAVVLTMRSFTQGPWPDLGTIGLLAGLAMIAEMLQVRVRGTSTISVSAGINFAAALLAGVPGVAFASAAIALMHYLRMRPPPYKTAFNWATHVLAGLAPLLVMDLLDIPLQLSGLPLLAIAAALAAVIYYAIDTGLVAAAISLSEGTSLTATWYEEFRWLGGHYLVLCLMGLFASVAYLALGLVGLVVFVLPVFMMHYAQRQYVERTQDSVEELRGMHRELSVANREIVEASLTMQQLNEALLMTLARMVDAHDAQMSGHSIKVATYATAIGKELDLPAERIEHIRRAALLHDIGKIAGSKQIVHKPDEATEKERQYSPTHAALGAELLKTYPGLQHLAPFVRHHRERWDGNGYPDGLRGERIPLEARVLAVGDAVDVMASDRPRHRGMSLGEIVSELRGYAGVQFDPAVVEAFVGLAERQGDRLIIKSVQEVVPDRGDSGGLVHYINLGFVFQEGGGSH